jgi:hypothetical protein
MVSMMLKLFQMNRYRAVTLAALGAALAVPLTASTPAEAWWAHGGWGWHPGVSIGIAAPVVVAPPPVYYAPPPPVVYAPPPAVVYGPPPAHWVRGHWRAGYWIPGHWA